MQTSLHHFAATLAEDAHAVLVPDRAGWHGSQSLVVPLPPYEPELNPVERVWLFLRERFLSHRLLAGYDAMTSARCEASNSLTPERFQSLCASPLGVPLTREGQFIGSAVSLRCVWSCRGIEL
jgi:hypothetical protein